MSANRKLAERAAAAGLLSAALLNPPLIRLFEGAALSLYVFAAWGVAVLLLALAMRPPG